MTTRTTERIWALIATILVIAALKLSRPVAMPLAAALCVAMVAWPLHEWLEARIPRAAAFTLTLLAVIGAATVIGSAVVWTFGRLADSTPEVMQRLEELSSSVRQMAARNRIALPGDAAGRSGELLTSTLFEGLTKGWRHAYSIPAAAGLVLAFLVFILLETRAFRRKIGKAFSADAGSRIVETATLVAYQVRRHFLGLTLSSAASGLLTTILALGVGLRYAVAWGIIAWLLNYIPVIGPVLSVIPPTLYALLQFDGFTRPLVVFAGTAAIQFTMGNFIDPKIEGRILSLSPFVVLFGVVFWTWVWGIPGAFLAVPLTAAIIVTCSQFESTKWIGEILTDDGSMK